jgi:hypothetical protein
MGNYITAADARAFRVQGSVVDLVGYADTDIDTDIELAESIIESITGDVFYSNSVTAYLDGNGLSELWFFPEVTGRALTVTSLVEVDDDGSTVLYTYTADDDYKLYDYYAAIIKADDRPRVRVGKRGVFPKGEKNIKVVGTFGRSAVPAEIKRATLLLVLERLAPGSTGIAPKDTVQASWSDFTVTYRGGDSATTGQSTGFPEVDRLLQGHVNYATMFNVVPDERQTYDNSPFKA